MTVVASVITARWTRWSCPHDEQTACGFRFELPELELRLTGDCPALTVRYADHEAAVEFFRAVQAEHERLDHAELLAERAGLAVERAGLAAELGTALGIPAPRRSTAALIPSG